MKTSSEHEPKVLSFKTPKQFEKWLDKNHNATNGIWLRFFKKDSGEKTITHSEALDEALCYGWIDGQANKFDDISWIQKFTPRRSKSIWSKRNTNHIKRLTSLGKMKPAGFAEVDKAKEDGRWLEAYDSPGEMTIPVYFIKELSKNKKSKAFFETLNKANKYSIGWRLQTAKKEETKQKRMKAILEMLSKGQKFH
ncbi:MAG: YdeI/OmpD-associated family protein [Ginsengibacter sp.]